VVGWWWWVGGVGRVSDGGLLKKDGRCRGRMTPRGPAGGVVETRQGKRREHGKEEQA